MGHRSRTEIFLSSLGVAPRTVQRLFRGLTRFETEPATREEEIVHDAVLLDAMGAYGITHGLADAYKERLDILEMADAIEAAAGALRTEPGAPSRCRAAGGHAGVRPAAARRAQRVFAAARNEAASPAPA